VEYYKNTFVAVRFWFWFLASQPNTKFIAAMTGLKFCLNPSRHWDLCLSDDLYFGGWKSNWKEI